MKSILATAIVAALLLSGCSSSTNRTEDARVASTQPAATSSETSASITAREATETQPLPTAPGTETTTTTISPPEPSSTTTTSNVPSETPETSIPPSTTSTSTTTTTSTTTSTTTTTTSTSTTTTTTSTTTTTTTLAPAVLRVKVLNGSGVAGAAGRLTNKLSQAGFDVLPAGNAPRRYSASAVYYAEGWLSEAKEILAEADIDEIEEPTAMPQQFASEEAVVVVLLGTDTAPVRAQTSLIPRRIDNVKLPLGDDVPRDRYVPGLSNINLYSFQYLNEQTEGTELNWRIRGVETWLRVLNHHRPEDQPTFFTIQPEARQTRQGYLNVLQAIEDDLEWLGFTPQNVCGAPAGYSFTDLLQPTREWDEELKTYGAGAEVSTTDRLLELHGGDRINPEANLDFYIQQAVQTPHDLRRTWELAWDVSTMQMILCAAWKMPSNDIPRFAGLMANYVATLAFLSNEPEIRPLPSQSLTYHFKGISRNGNLAYLVECGADRTPRFFMLWWRNGGYRAQAIILKEGTGYNDYLGGCQEMFYEYDDILSGQVPDEFNDLYFTDDTIFFNFGEHVFAGKDLLDFPRG